MTTSIDATNVTEDQINACSRIIDENRNEVFYQVTSQTDSSVEYTVRFSLLHGFTCTCPAGEAGFVNCHNYCWHVRAAVAHSEWYKAEMHRLNQDERETVENDPAFIAEYHEYQAAIALDSCAPQAAPAKKDIRAAKALQTNRNKGFSLMR